MSPNQNQIKIKLYNVILNYIQNHNWVNYDEFADDFTDNILEQFQKNNFDLDVILEHSKGSFLGLNGVKSDQFLNSTFRNAILKAWNKAIKLSIPSLSFAELFPEVTQISDADARKKIQQLDLDESIIQKEVRDALREKGATPMPQRGKDSALEIAEPEHFHMRQKGADLSFSAVVKGYNSLAKVNLKQIMHQIVKAYTTHPDHILFISAKEPVDGLITQLAGYAKDVGNPNLIVYAFPLDLAKFLIWRKII